MKRISKRIKYDFIIYTCLILALILIGYSSKEYLANQSYSIKEIFTQEDIVTIIDEEPQELVRVNKIEIINKYLLDIIDEIKKDKILTSKMILDWKAYEVMNVYYNKKIATNYYSYTADIKISNINNSYHNLENKDLNTDKYLVITLNFNLLKDPITNEYYVKSTDIPKND
jgi:hypothetical protein